jgi:hypothetical protein
MRSQMAMRLTVGDRLTSAVDATTMMVVRSPDQPVDISCGNQPMLKDGADTSHTTPPSDSDASLIGKRYVVAEIEIELLCVRGGAATVTVNGVLVHAKPAKPLPASD